jgi:hypothetical protein
MAEATPRKSEQGGAGEQTAAAERLDQRSRTAGEAGEAVNAVK